MMDGQGIFYFPNKAQIFIGNFEKNVLKSGVLKNDKGIFSGDMNEDSIKTYLNRGFHSIVNFISGIFGWLILQKKLSK